MKSDSNQTVTYHPLTPDRWKDVEGFFLIVFMLFASLTGAYGQESKFKIKEYKVPKGSHPHDVAPAPDGTVWYTAQHQEALGILDPATGRTKHVHLGDGSRPHGVIVGPDGNAWITDSGLNAMVRVDALTLKVTVYPLPKWTGYVLPVAGSRIPSAS